jgi:hypothetical protein
LFGPAEPLHMKFHRHNQQFHWCCSVCLAKWWALNNQTVEQVPGTETLCFSLTFRMRSRYWKYPEAWGSHSGKFEVAGFGDVTSRSRIKWIRRFEETCCLHEGLAYHSKIITYRKQLKFVGIVIQFGNELVIQSEEVWLKLRYF